jgi:hypothetical protein
VTSAGRHDSRSARRAPFAVLVFGLLGGGLVLLLGLNTASAANELRRHDLAARDESVAASLVEMRNAVAASAAPQNLARHAAEYGMVPAGNPAFLVVGAAGSVRVLGSPAPATAPPLPLPSSSSPEKAKAKAKAKATKSAAPKRSSQPRKPQSRTARAAAHTSTASHQSTASRTSAPNSTRTPAHKPSPAPTPSPTKPRPPTPSSTPVPTITLPGGTR